MAATPIGKLRVHMYSAKDLPAASEGDFQTLRPYLAVRFRDSQNVADPRIARRTQTKEGPNPEWHLAVDLDVLSVNDALEISVFVEGPGGNAPSNKLIGQAVVPISSIPKGRQHWLKLNNGGQMLVAITDVPPTPNTSTPVQPPEAREAPPAVAQAPAPVPAPAPVAPHTPTSLEAVRTPTKAAGVIDFRIVEGNFEAAGAQFDGKNPFCSVIIGGQTFKTACHPNSKNPQWADTFRAQLPANVTSLDFELRAQDGTLLGRGTHSLANLFAQQKEDCWEAIFDTKNLHAGRVHAQFIFHKLPQTSPQAAAPAPAPVPAPVPVPAPAPVIAPPAPAPAPPPAPVPAPAPALVEQKPDPRDHLIEQQASVLRDLEAKLNQSNSQLAAVTTLKNAAESTVSELREKVSALETQKNDLDSTLRSTQSQNAQLQSQAQASQNGSINNGIIHSYQQTIEMQVTQMADLKAQLRAMEERARAAESQSYVSRPAPTQPSPLRPLPHSQSASLTLTQPRPYQTSSVTVSPELQRLLAEQEAWLSQLRARTGTNSLNASSYNSSISHRDPDLPSMLL